MNKRECGNNAAVRPWSWWSIGVAVVLLHPFGLVPLDDGLVSVPISSAAAISAVLGALTVLVAAVLLHVDTRMHPTTIGAPLALVATFFAFQALPFAVMAGYGGRWAEPSFRWGLAAIGLGLAVIHARLRRGPVLNPLGEGAAIGLAAAVLRIGAGGLGLNPAVDVGSPADVAPLLAVAAGTALLANATVNEMQVGGRVRSWMLVTAGLLTFAHVVGAVQITATSTFGALLTGVASLLILTCAVETWKQTAGEQRQRIDALAQRAATAEAGLRRDREVVHEMTATVAGLVAAEDLLTRESGPARSQRQALEEMVHAELGRLSRILGDRTDRPQPLALDDVVGRLVVAQEALGHRIEWTPGGHAVVGRSDAVTEILNVLLTNARRYATTTTTVTTSARDGTIDIRVSDDGPGVSAALEPWIFHWGARHPESPGQGLGLPIARRLAHEQGGRLVLESEAGLDGGATFVLSLPAASRTPASRPVRQDHRIERMLVST